MLRVSRALKRAVNWQRAVPALAPEVASKYTARANELEAIWKEVRAAPTQVDEIDWAYWKGQIKDKAAFEALKKDFEAGKDKVVPVKPYRSAEEQAKAMKQAEGKVAYFEELTQVLQARIKNLDHSMRTFIYQDLTEHVPEVVIEHYLDFGENFDFAPPRALMDKLDAMDLPRYVKDLQDGKVPFYYVRLFEEACPPGSRIYEAVKANYEKTSQQLLQKHTIQCITFEQMLDRLRAQDDKIAVERGIKV